MPQAQLKQLVKNYTDAFCKERKNATKKFFAVHAACLVCKYVSIATGQLITQELRMGSYGSYVNSYLYSPTPSIVHLIQYYPFADRHNDVVDITDQQYDPSNKSFENIKTMLQEYNVQNTDFNIDFADYDFAVCPIRLHGELSRALFVKWVTAYHNAIFTLRPGLRALDFVMAQFINAQHSFASECGYYQDTIAKSLVSHMQGDNVVHRAMLDSINDDRKYNQLELLEMKKEPFS